MKGGELVKRIRRLGAERGVAVTDRTGKGSHTVLYYGAVRATVPDLRRDLKIGTLHAILRQLGLAPKEIGL
ncbi:MAG: type II toxin-antitoxin system HicA family toxin [Alphaproteobacteria bacterium]|nr:type II toxin-antitoxin system HicA family toxin [Alphaproteobacteria bacterium]